MSDPQRPSDYRPLSRRRRLLIVLLAVTTAVVVVLTLLDPPGGVQRPRGAATAAPTGPAPCGPGQQSGCVGAKADVLAPASAGGR